MRKLSFDELEKALSEHKMEYVDKAENEILQGNNAKAQIYNAKANAVRECISIFKKWKS